MKPVMYALLEISWCIVGIASSRLAGDYARLTRGYSSIGSEILVGPLVAVIGWCVTCKIIDGIKLTDDEDDEEENEDNE